MCHSCHSQYPTPWSGTTWTNLYELLFCQNIVIRSLFLDQTFYPLQFRQKFLAPICNIKLCHSINKQFSIDSFLDWECHHWVFNSRVQTTACDSLHMQAILSQNNILILTLINLNYFFWASTKMNHYRCLIWSFLWFTWAGVELGLLG